MMSSLRKTVVGLLAVPLIAVGIAAHAGGLDLLSDKDAVAGLREALTRGAAAAVGQLGKTDGFLGNAKVKIPLPPSLEKAEGLLRTFGGGKEADELVVTMNRAAETAVVEAKPLLVDAVKKMSVDDAKGILQGGDDAATQYFRRTTSEPLAKRFLPVVRKATAKVRLAEKYDRFAGSAAKYHLIDEKDAKLDDYVTRKALDGLYRMIAEQEKAIRKDPVGTGSSLLKKVFGALGG